MCLALSTCSFSIISLYLPRDLRQNDRGGNKKRIKTEWLFLGEVMSKYAIARVALAKAMAMCLFTPFMHSNTTHETDFLLFDFSQSIECAKLGV